MHIGVTGGAGYIGSHVVRDLLADGHSVIVIDNLALGSRLNILPDGPNYRFIEGDICRDADLNRFLETKPDVIFHFAALKAAGVSMHEPLRYADNNVRGTLKLIKRMFERGCRHFVFSSSAAVYGEPEYLPLDEKHPVHPINYYGYTKLAIEQNLRWFSQLIGLRFAALRYFNAAGYDVQGRVAGLEREPNNLLPILMEVASGIRPYIEIFGRDYDTPDGTCVRDYIHVSDLSSAHVLAMQYIVAQDRDLIVNLGSETGLSVQEMLAMAREVTGHAIPHRDGPRRAGDPPRLVASAGLAREYLQWSPRHSDLRTLVSSAWKVYQQSKELHN